MNAQIMTPGDERWASELAAIRHDVYHVAPYVEFAARWQEPGVAHAFAAQDAGQHMFVPFIVRSLPGGSSGAADGLTDAVAPRGFPGPIVGSTDGAVDGSFVEAATDAFVAALAERGIVSAYLLTHPFLVPPLDPLRRAGPLLPAAQTVSIDLTLSMEELWTQTRDNHRRDINKARRNGYQVRIDDEWTRFDEFVELHGLTMDRLGAHPFWRHSREYFVGLREALEGHIHLCVVEIGGELAAAAILTEVDGIALYLTSGSADAHKTASPMKLVIDFARSWAKDRGNRILHLGGSPRGADALIHFKLGFSPLVHEVYSWRVIADADSYRRLSDERAAADPGDAATDAGSAGFFPSYRRPLPVTAAR